MSNSLKLMTETVEDVRYVLEEGAAGEPKKLFIEGVYMQAGIPNRNKRIYPIDVLAGEVNRYVRESVEKNSALGELNHPTTPTINLDRVCILIKELKQDGNNFIGRAQVTSTPQGEIVRGLINDGVRIGVSSRALGSLRPLSEGINEVQKDLRLLAVDVVSDPSAPDAYVQGILENVEYFFDAAKGTLIEKKLDDVRSELRSMTVSEINENKVRLFGEFLEGLKTVRK